MKKGIKFLVIFTSVVLVLGTSGFLTYFFVFNPDLFTPCSEEPFTAYPVNMSRLLWVTPLGNLNPPGHTYPTDHMYFFTNSTAYPDGFEIYAPGNITITAIELIEYDPPQIAGVTTDYTFDFVVCSKVTGTFGHVNNISSFLSDQIGDFGEPDDSYEIDGRTYTRYTIRKTIEVPSGQLLGRAGVGGGGYDFWLKDTRVTLDWVNSGLGRNFQNTVCPLAYFRADLQATLIGYLQGWDGPTDPPGYCGRIDFDVPNTAQGIWAQEGYENDRDEEYGLALVYSNLNASKGAISIGNAGNSAFDKNVYYFNPTSSGFMNRNFSQVTNDGNIYYYVVDYWFVGSSFQQAILIKMTGDRELQLQYVNAGVDISADPTAYFNPAEAITYYR